MAQYRVLNERTEVEYAIIEADSAEEAEKLADSNYSEYDWTNCDGSMTASILIGQTTKESTNE